MSLIIAVFTREGIVMGSDSRLTLTNTETVGGKTVVNPMASISDSAYKTFLAAGNIGISTCGDATIGTVPISGYIESFIEEKMMGKSLSLSAVPQSLIDYFGSFNPIPNTYFHVAGYEKNGDAKEQKVFSVDIRAKTFRHVNATVKQNVTWSGETDVLLRLINRVGQLDDANKLIQPLAFYSIPYAFFSLQDAIDFCIFAIRSTVEAFRFQLRPKTVGGAIDILVIKPDEAKWIMRKELKVRDLVHE